MAFMLDRPTIQTLYSGKSCESVIIVLVRNFTSAVDVVVNT